MQAVRFQCHLVSTNDGNLYCQGVVDFDFKSRDIAREAAARFVEGSVWDMSKVDFETKDVAQFNGSSHKVVVNVRTTIFVELSAEQLSALHFDSASRRMSPKLRLDQWSEMTLGKAVDCVVKIVGVGQK